MINMKPMTRAVPNAWIVSATGHPKSELLRIQAETASL